jgi:predicted nucleotidyltransferase
MLVNSALDTRREEILGIVRRHGGRNVRVFGSQARGEGAPDSDVDILIDLESGRSLLDIVAIKQDLEDLLGCSVDVVTEASVSPYIREHVLSEAIAL